jgi:hypothetical protein
MCMRKASWIMPSSLLTLQTLASIMMVLQNVRSLGVGRGLTTPHCKTLYLLWSMYKGLGNGRILWHDLSTG